MPPKKRKFISLSLAVLSIGLLLLPPAWSQKVGLSVVAGYVPFRSLALKLQDLMNPGPSPGVRDELRRQNEYFRDLVVRLMNENGKLQARLEQASGLRVYLKDRAFRIIHGDIVIPTDASVWRRSLTVSPGSNAGVERGMLVLYNNRLVGGVVEVGPWTARVRLTTDSAFRAGAVSVPQTCREGISFDPRHVGLYEGTGGDRGILKWLTGDTPVDPGATVTTTEDPANGIPAGLVIGRVAAVNSGRGQYPRVDVEPAVNFRGLEQVMLMASPYAP